jgi:hypothetical protein
MAGEKFKKGDLVEDIYTQKINIVKRVYWQWYEGRGDWTVIFEPTVKQPTGWNKASNLRRVELDKELEKESRDLPRFTNYTRINRRR